MIKNYFKSVFRNYGEINISPVTKIPGLRTKLNQFANFSCHTTIDWKQLFLELEKQNEVMNGEL